MVSQKRYMIAHTVRRSSHKSLCLPTPMHTTDVTEHKRAVCGGCTRSQLREIDEPTSCNSRAHQPSVPVSLSTCSNVIKQRGNASSWSVDDVIRVIVHVLNFIITSIQLLLDLDRIFNLGPNCALLYSDITVVRIL